MIIMFQLVFAAMFISLRFIMPILFNDEREVRDLVSALLLIAALFQLSDGIQVVALGALRGIKDVTIPTWITCIVYWMIGLPCSYVLAFIFGFGLEGIWYGLTIALTLAAIFLYLRFNYVSKRLSF